MLYRERKYLPKCYPKKIGDDQDKTNVQWEALGAFYLPDFDGLWYVGYDTAENDSQGDKTIKHIVERPAQVKHRNGN